MSCTNIDKQAGRRGLSLSLFVKLHCSLYSPTEHLPFSVQQAEVRIHVMHEYNNQTFSTSRSSTASISRMTASRTCAETRAVCQFSAIDPANSQFALGETSATSLASEGAPCARAFSACQLTGSGNAA